MKPDDAKYTTEYHRGMGLSFETTAKLYDKQSLFQKVEIVDTTTYGKLLLLDGCVMTTDKDEFVYHEMISHVPMNAHPNPKRVLVIGGGDGGTVREVIKHQEVEEVVLCEIDGLVVESCKEHFPQLTSGLSDPRVNVIIGDGVAYMKDEAQNFDVIIVDSADPIGPGEGLFTKEFYQNVFNALNEGGILVAQTESPFVCQDLIQKIYPMYQAIFPKVAMYTGHIPTYPSGFWTWAFCSKGPDFKLTTQGKARADEIAKNAKYYNAELHDASFALPNFVKDLLKVPTSANA